MGKKDSEKFKVYENVFDEKTLNHLEILRRKGYFDELKHIIKPGKEAVVYKATRKNKDLAIKIYMITSSNFKKIYKYIEKDIRFKSIKGNKRKIIMAWVQKEGRNLKILYKAGVNVPYSYKFFQNILIMDYIPGNTLNNVYLSNPKRFLSVLKEQIKLFVKTGLVHCDLSPYNIIVEKESEMPYIIDVGQSIIFKNEEVFYENKDMIIRDLNNIFIHFEKRYELKTDVETFLKEIEKEIFNKN